MKAEIINGLVWSAIDDKNVAQALTDNNTTLQYVDDYGAFHEITHGSELDMYNHVKDVFIGLELGHEAELKSDWQEATARNNETRCFEAWLQDKAEALIN